MEMREINVYTILLNCKKKSCDNIHGMTYITSIMLCGIAIMSTGYFDNTNDKKLLKIKVKGIAKITFSLTNIGSLEGTLQYSHNATPGGVLLGLHGDCTEGFFL